MSGREALLSVEEVAGLLKLPPATVREMARRGALPGFKLGKAWRFHPADLRQRPLPGRRGTELGFRP